MTTKWAHRLFYWIHPAQHTMRYEKPAHLVCLDHRVPGSTVCTCKVKIIIPCKNLLWPVCCILISFPSFIHCMWCNAAYISHVHDDKVVWSDAANVCTYMYSLYHLQRAGSALTLIFLILPRDNALQGRYLI